MTGFTKLRSVLLAGGASLGALAFAMPAAAQDDQAVQMEEIIVTARKREERLQDVPLSVTAITGQALERENIVQVNDLARKSPSLTMSPGLGSNRSVPNFAIRGLSQQEQTLLSDQSVSVYVGDIVAARAQGLNQALIDIGSVEVLKGPQGTLFGRNATGGAIIIRPNRPTADFSGSLAVTLGNLNTRNTEAMLNIPVSEQLKIRLAGGTQQSDGYIRDVLLNKYINNTDTWSFRASVQFDPTADISSLTVYNIFNEDDGGQGSYINSINPNGSFNSAPARASRNYDTLENYLAQQRARGTYDTASGTPMFTRIRTWDLANTTTWKLSDNITLKNIIGVRSVDSHNYEDTDGLPIPLLEIERRINVDQFSEEFQVLGDHGNLSWIAGAYYFYEDGSDSGASVTGATDPGVLQPGSVFLYPSYSDTFVESQNTSYAVFAQGTYKLDNLLSGLALTVGARQNWDKREAAVKNRTNSACRFTIDADGNPATPEVPATLATCVVRPSADFSEPTYNISLDWKVDADTLLYVAHRHGYRTGGFGARAATEQGLRTAFRPEIIDDVELGLKRDWHIGDAFLRTNLAVFRGKYKDIQRLLTNPTTIPVTTTPVNAGEATIQGAEFEFNFRPNSFFELSGFWSYTDAHFDSFIAPDGTDYTNNPFARAPANIYSITARVNLPLDESLGDLSAGLTWFHSDEWYANDDTPTERLANGNPNPNFIYKSSFLMPGYELLNFDAQWRRVGGSDVDISFFVNNITDEVVVYPELNIITSLGFDARTLGPPRTYGVRLKYSF